jgi:nitrogen fixation protein NifU and related proteins
VKEAGGDRQADLRALYQSVILEHNRAPRNRGAVPGETHRARGFNPLCGDDVTVSLRLESDAVAAAGFEGKGCAICTAAASCMTEVCAGRSVQQLAALAEGFEAMVRRGEAGTSAGQLEAFAPVAGFPSRIKCAILPWRALVHAMSGDEDVATTEDP